MTPKYLKLGANATSYTDTLNRFTLVKGQVIKLEAEDFFKSQSVSDCLRGGHLEEAKEEEYNKYLEGIPTTPNVVTNDIIPPNNQIKTDESNGVDYEELTKTELIDLIKLLPDVADEDKKDLTKKSEAVLIELHKKYYKKPE